jgi:murein DD-endopeptidase MepM/ murein hydrolase activator NlpD
MKPFLTTQEPLRLIARRDGTVRPAHREAKRFMGARMTVRRTAGGPRLRIAALCAVLGALTAPSLYSPALADPTTPLPPASVTKVPTGRSLEQLQAEAAALQADFAKATIAYTAATKKAEQARAAATAADAEAASTQAAAEEARRRLGRITAQAYQLGIPTSLGAESMLWSLSAVAENLQDLADRQSAITVAGTNQANAYQASVDADNAAQAAATDAAAKRAAADTAAEAAGKLADDVQQKAAVATQKMQDWLSQLELAGAVSDELQKTRNTAALARWRSYLMQLTTAGISAPKAAALANPAKLPAGLKALNDANGHAVRGAAQVVRGGHAIRVLPAETIHAVSAAFGLLGRPYGVGGTGPDAYGCLGAARAAWSPYTTLPRRVSKVYNAYQQVPAASAQPGDLLLIGEKSVGLFHIGIAIGDGEMVAADESRGSVVVTAVPDNVYAVVRPTLGKPATEQIAPRAGSSAFSFRCGAVQQTFTAGSGDWVWPLPDGTYTIGTPFGEPGPLWATGYHTGQDFPAAIGTTVRAVTGGTAYVEHPGWAGNLVRIDHGDGLETLYAHLSTVTVANGDHVLAGQHIGGVGTEGNSTGPHLHFEVRLGGQPVNPMPFLATGGGTLGWGGYSNGMIPASKLCAIGVAGHVLRCDAAAAYRSLAAAFEKRFGRHLCITDSYRSYAQQVTLYAAKPSLAALPGTSNHGWGLAVDLCGGIERFGSTEHSWMKANASRYGWTHPHWAEPGGSRPEPWHWEFATGSA